MGVNSVRGRGPGAFGSRVLNARQGLADTARKNGVDAHATKWAEQLTAAFAKPSAELAGSSLYVVGLLLTAAVVLLLPVFYIALIGAVGVLGVWHAIENVY